MEKLPLSLLSDSLVYNMGPGVQLLTNAVTVGEPKNAFHLVEGHVLLDLYHIPVEAGAGAVEEIGRS